MATPYTLLENSAQAIFPISNTISSSGISGIFSSLWILGITSCILAAMGILAINGLKLQGVDSGNKEREIKEDIKRAVYGVIGVLALWLILNQINPQLLRGEISFAKINTGSGTGTEEPPANPPPPPGSPASEANMRTALASIPISINNATPCTGGNRTGCTNVGGMRDETLQMLTALRSNCSGCDITITGGTEDGHVSHGVGKLPVDLRKTDSLDAKVRSGSIISPPATFCIAEYRYIGWRFCDEAPPSTPHWHVYQ